MERKEAYAKIKSLNLQEECKKKYGKNFTQCKTDELAHLVQSFIIKEKQFNEAKKGTYSSTDVKKAIKKEATVENGDKKDLWSVVKDLIKTLHSKHILLDSEVKRILG